MRTLLAILLNLPWSIAGLFLALISIPKKIKVSFNPPAVIFYTHSFWWELLIPGRRGRRARAIATGNIVQLSPNILKADLEHELVHVEQAQRAPFVHPILYIWSVARHGYRYNKYEREAYDRAGNPYLDGKPVDNQSDFGE